MSTKRQNEETHATRIIKDLINGSLAGAISVYMT